MRRVLNAILAVTVLAACQQVVPATPDPPRGVAVEWDDADSGRIDGERFRVFSIDAPETGGVGARIGAAGCEGERALGLAAKAWAQSVTADATVTATGEHGFDRMSPPRRLVDLSINGRDYGAMGIAAGHLRSWPHDGSKALAPKPDWCS